MSWPTVSVIASWLFLVGSLWGAWFTWNAYRPIASHPRLSIVSFFAGWLTTELALHHLAWQVLVTIGFIWLGALGHWPGWVGLGITLASWVGLAGCLRTARGAEEVVERALRDGLGAGYREQIDPALAAATLTPRVDWRDILLPFSIRHPKVERIRNIRYARVAGQNIRLDVYRSPSHPTGCPVLLQVHGGGWVLGSKNEQGLPLMRRLAERGWVCVSADYRLSPRATFPDHLDRPEARRRLDPRAHRRVRRRSRLRRGDRRLRRRAPGLAGGAHGQRSASTSPASRTVDTSVRGVRAVLRRVRLHQPVRPCGGTTACATCSSAQVMKASLDEAPEAYEAASPCRTGHSGDPPFFVIHGIARHAGAGRARRATSARPCAGHARVPVVYAEIPGAQHAFEIFPSLRTTFVLHGVERFLAWVVSQRRVGLPAVERNAPAA